MIQFLESIRLVDGVLQQLDLHQQRVNGTLATHYKTNILLSSIEIPTAYREGIYKCRIVYDEKIQEVAFQPYTLKPRKCVKLVYANDIDYQYKYADRTLLNKLWHKANTDDIVIVKNGLLSNSANRQSKGGDKKEGGINFETPPSAMQFSLNSNAVNALPGGLPSGFFFTF